MSARNVSIRRCDKGVSIASSFGFSFSDECVSALERHFIESGGRLVILASHTSAQEAVLSACIARHLDIAPTLLVNLYNRKWPLLPASIICLESDAGISTTQKTIDALRARDRFSLVMSLLRRTRDTHEGTPIKSGYYYIARATGAHIIVAGFDYALRRYYVSEARWNPSAHADSYADFQRNASGEPLILREFQSIWPLRPRQQFGFSSRDYHELHGHDQKTVRRIERRGVLGLREQYCTLVCVNQTPLVIFATLLLLFLLLLTSVRRHRRLRQRKRRV